MLLKKKFNCSVVYDNIRAELANKRVIPLSIVVTVTKESAKLKSPYNPC